MKMRMILVLALVVPLIVPLAHGMVRIDGEIELYAFPPQTNTAPFRTLEFILTQDGRHWEVLLTNYTYREYEGPLAIQYYTDGDYPRKREPAEIAPWIGFCLPFQVKPDTQVLIPNLFSTLAWPTNQLKCLLETNRSSGYANKVTIWKPGVVMRQTRGRKLEPVSLPSPFDTGYVGLVYEATSWTDSGMPQTFVQTTYNVSPKSGSYEVLPTTVVLGRITSIVGSVNGAQVSKNRPLSETAVPAKTNTQFHPQQTGQSVPAYPLPAARKKPEEIKFNHASFTFVRIKYSTVAPRRGSSWATDFPDADRNFTTRFQKVTRLKGDTNGLVMELTDAKLKQQPFIYIAEGGQLHLKPEEVQSLRDYLLGGGFLMVDDFWGEAEWSALHAEMKRVFPERELVELPLDHAVFHCYYDIRDKPQVPNMALGTQSQFTGITWERADAKQAHYRGLFDDKGRLMAIFCHNTDLGDGWEREGENEYYFREFSLKKAYPMGINIVVYALTQ